MYNRKIGEQKKRSRSLPLLPPNARMEGAEPREERGLRKVQLRSEPEPDVRASAQPGDVQRPDAL